jgi:hypothetical protein
MKYMNIWNRHLKPSQQINNKVNRKTLLFTIPAKEHHHPMIVVDRVQGGNKKLHANWRVARLVRPSNQTEDVTNHEILLFASLTKERHPLAAVSDGVQGGNGKPYVYWKVMSLVQLANQIEGGENLKTLLFVTLAKERHLLMTLLDGVQGENEKLHVNWKVVRSLHLSNQIAKEHHPLTAVSDGVQGGNEKLHVN